MSHFHDRNQAKQSTNEGKSQWEYTQEFENAIRQAGIDLTDKIIADGEIHRFKPGGKGKPNGWYIFHGMAGAFGDWSQDISQKWSSSPTAQALTPQQREQRQEEIDKSRKALEQEIRCKNQEAVERALKDWNSFSETGQSDYLLRKKVDAIGIRFSKGFIAILLRDVDGKIWSYQTIRPDGTKRFLSGGRKKGCFHTLGQLEDGSPIYVTEGYSTGASVYMATGIPTVIAFDSGNLDPVIAALKEKYPKSGIIIAGDDDCWKDGVSNAGRKAAEAVSKKHRCKAAFPNFKNTETKPSDWNDLHVLEGIEAVQQQMGSIDSVLNEMSKGFPELRPLYNLHDLTQRPEAPVLIVEGEKTAEAAKRLFPDYVVTTSAQGSQSPHKADWSPLKGRAVTICPDFDKAGTDYGDAVIQLCREVEAHSLHYMPVQDLVRKLLEKSEIAEGYDLADAVSDGLTAEILKQHSLSDFLIPISENETISDLIKNRLQRLFDNSLFPVFKKTKLFKKNVKEASTQSKKNQQEKAEIDVQIATLDTEIQEQELCLKKKEEELPSLKLTAAQKEDIWLKKRDNAESKAAFKQADEERKNCQRFIKNLEDILCVKHREKTVLQSKAAVLTQQIHDTENIETRLQNDLWTDFKMRLSEGTQPADDLNTETKSLLSLFETENPDISAILAEAEHWLKDESLLIGKETNGATFSDENGGSNFLSAQFPQGFRLTEKGQIEYYWEKKDKQGQVTDSGWSWLCTYLVVTHRGRNKDNKSWNKLLKLIDGDGILKEFIMPSSMIAGDGATLKEALLSLGVTLNIHATKPLTSYLSMSNPKSRFRSVDKTGWYGKSYVLPHTIYSENSEEKLILQLDEQLPFYRVKRTLAEWQKNIGKYAEGNSILQIGIIAEIAAPFLRLCEEDNFFLHFYGLSSRGKSTALHVSCSVSGKWSKDGSHRLPTWKSTGNAIEASACENNDACMVLDELHQATPDEIGKIIYMVGNGTGKARAYKSGMGRPISTFNTIGLSSGEQTLAERLREAKKGNNHTAGQSVRFIEIPTDSIGGQNGIYETLHNFKDGASLSKYLDLSSKKYCGTFLDTWLTYCVKCREEALTLIAEYKKKWLEENPVESKADGQVLRVRDKYAFLAAVGELAISQGFLPWAKGSAFKACSTLFNCWLNHRGGIESHELMEFIKRTEMFLQQDGSARFEIIQRGNQISDESVQPDTQKIIYKRAGFREFKNGRWTYYAFTSVFDEEVIGSGNKKHLLNALVEKNYLIKDSKHFAKEKSLPGEGKKRVYWLKLPEIAE